MANFNLNKVILGGRITADIELKHTQSGVSTTTFQIAVNRKVGKEQEQQADFITCVAWRNTADVVEKYVKKGTQVYIEGRIRTRSWDDQTGNKRYTTEIMADTLQLLGKRQDNPAGQGGYAAQPVQAQQGYAQPQQSYQQQYQQPAPAQSYSQPAAPQNIAEDGPEDDLPF